MMQKDLIYDVGMHNGDDTAYYLARGYRVVAIEADPGLVANAKKRFADALAGQRLQIVNVGIADTAGTAEFWVCESHTHFSAFDRRIASRSGTLPHHAVQVPTAPLDALFDQYGVPYYLKIDIELSDILCLRHLRAGALPKYVSFESAQEQGLGILAHLGYTHFKLISQFQYLPVEIQDSAIVRRFRRWTAPQPSLSWLDRWRGLQSPEQAVKSLRQLGDYTFPEGASGPFGEETRGRWQSLQQIRRTLEFYTQKQRRKEDCLFWLPGNPGSFWADMHARRPD